MAPIAKAQASDHPARDDGPPPGGPLERLPGEEPPLVLALDDLVRDPDGEVVLFNDSGLRTLAISSPTVVVEEGEAGRHVTAAGEDVSGFRYVAFANGLRLYYQPGLDLIVVDEPVALD
jgi:hypothetical protein